MFDSIPPVHLIAIIAIGAVAGLTAKYNQSPVIRLSVFLGCFGTVIFIAMNIH